jgi:hypothetical protein
MPAKITGIENIMIDTAQEMRTRHLAIEVERVEELVLPGSQLTRFDAMSLPNRASGHVDLYWGNWRLQWLIKTGCIRYVRS